MTRFSINPTWVMRSRGWDIEVLPKKLFHTATTTITANERTNKNIQNCMFLFVQ